MRSEGGNQMVRVQGGKGKEMRGKDDSMSVSEFSSCVRSRKENATAKYPSKIIIIMC